MRVGLVRNVRLSAVALLALGLAGCDDNPLEFEDGVAAMITTNPSSMTIVAGSTTLLESRTIDEGSRPTREEITTTVDASCGPGTVSIAVAATYEPSVDAPGKFDVTGGTTLGTTCITLEGGGVTASVDVAVVGASLAMAGPAQIIFETTGQVTATLLGANAEVLSPFESTTDLVWTTSASAIMTVDGTGLVTAAGVGSADIIGTWTDPTGSGVVVVGSISIEVPPLPIPVISAVTPATGDLGQVITVTGVDIFSVTNVFIDGAETPFTATVVSPTELTFLMPANLALGAHDIAVGTTGGFAFSNAISYTSTAGFTNGSTEPANDDFTTPTPVALPFVLNDGVDAVDAEDFWLITVASTVTLDLILAWDDVADDLDFAVIDAGFTAFECTGGATLANPEVISDCELDAGDHLIRVQWFGGGGPAVYSLGVK